MDAVFVPTKEDGTKTHWFTVMGMGAMLLCIKLVMGSYKFLKDRGSVENVNLRRESPE